MKRHVISLVLIVVLSYWSVRSLLSAGFFPMHDDTQVGRVVAMGRALRNGQFPVRWVGDLGYGYGYPLFNFYGPLPYYFGGALYALGVTGLAATKAMFITGILLAGFAMYLFISVAVGRIAGLVSALLYVYAPYHAVQMYVRGAVGEFWEFAFFPLIPLGFFLMRRIHSRLYGALITGLGLAGVLLSHTLLGLFTAAVVLGAVSAYWLIRLCVRLNDHPLFRAHALGIGIGFGLSAFFWLPAILEMHMTSVSGQIGPTSDFRDHFVCVGQLWNSSWGFGGSAPGCIDGLSFKLGKIHVIAALIGTFAFWIRRNERRNFMFLYAVGIGTIVGSFFLLLPYSRLVWEAIPALAYIQYPWRFLTFTVFGLAVASSGIFLFFRARTLRVIVAIIMIIGTIVVQAKVFQPQYTYHKTTESFEDIRELRFRVSRISDEYLPKELIRPASSDEIVFDTVPQTPGVVVEPIVEKEIYRMYIFHAQNVSDIVFNSAHFPGWKYFLNGQNVRALIVEGRPSLRVPVGDSTFEMRFTDTPVRSIANIISLVTLLSVVFIYGKKTVA